MSTTPHDNDAATQDEMSNDPQLRPEQDESNQEESSSDPAQIEADIARHRAELGDTVDEITDRLDVKKRAQRKVESAKTRANAGLEQVKARLHSDDHRDVLSVVAPALGTAAAVVLLIGVARRVRR